MSRKAGADAEADTGIQTQVARTAEPTTRNRHVIQTKWEAYREGSGVTMGTYRRTVKRC